MLKLNRCDSLSGTSFRTGEGILAPGGRIMNFLRHYSLLLGLIILFSIVAIILVSFPNSILAKILANIFVVMSTISVVNYRDVGIAAGSIMTSPA